MPLMTNSVRRGPYAYAPTCISAP